MDGTKCYLVKVVLRVERRDGNEVAEMGDCMREMLLLSDLQFRRLGSHYVWSDRNREIGQAMRQQAMRQQAPQDAIVGVLQRKRIWANQSSAAG